MHFRVKLTNPGSPPPYSSHTADFAAWFPDHTTSSLPHPSPSSSLSSTSPPSTSTCRSLFKTQEDASLTSGIYNNSKHYTNVLDMLDYCSSLVANDAAHGGYTPHHLHHHHSTSLPHHSPGSGSSLSSNSSSGTQGHSPSPAMASILGMAHAGAGLESSSSPRLTHHTQTQQQHQQQQSNHQSQQQQQQQQNQQTSHQQQQHQQQSAFLLSSPPLAALHNLTEMKFPSSSNGSFLGQDYSPDALKQMHAAMSHALSTPHGINDILSRPHAALGLPRLGAAAAAAGMYHHLGAHHQSRFPKLAELPGRPPIYWPGVLPQPWRPP
ncbi:homeobox protein nkx-6.2, partial [Plakobranchus ocellatus]